MADQNIIKSQLENNAASFNLEQIKEVPEELDKVIGALAEIRAANRGLNSDQQKIYNSAVKYRNELEKTTAELEKGGNAMSRWARGAQDLSSGIESFGRALQAPFDAMNKLGGAWGKADQAANDFGKTIGGNTRAVAQLRDESIKFANDVHIGEKYNASIADMIKLQQDYTKTVGRNLQISDKQRETLLATSKLMGQNTTEFASKLENMGIGLERSGDLAAKMFNDASKSGISFEKYSQSVTQNLTKVQSYGFKNGVEGLSAMAKKAAEVNLNIAEAFKVADKIQTGGIESAIKMGANLQVLGGTFAQFGDPMGMLYQGLNDMEGLQDRMIKMFSGLGELENGQVKISGANRLRVNAAAQAMGVSSDEMYKMISRQAIRDVVSQQMKGNAAFTRDAELAELVQNTATLNKNNEAVVNIRGEEKKLKDITDKDKDYLKNLQKTESEDIKDIAQILRGYTDVQGGFTKEIENKKAQAFSNIGKATKMIYDKLGQTNVALEIIKDGVLAITVAQALGSIAGGFGRTFGRGGGAGRGIGGGATRGGGMAGGGFANTTQLANGTYQHINPRTGRSTIYTADQMAARQARANQIAASRGTSAASSVTKGGAGRAAGGTGARIAGAVARGGAKFVGGAALGGVMTGIGYLADGSFTNGNQSDKVKAIGGTVGSAILGGLGTMFLGPVGGMIGAELGKFAGEAVGKWVNKGRAKKKDELSKELGGEKGQAIANLSDSYSRAELKKIKKAMEDGKITEGELSERLMKKMAKRGDTDIVQKYGTTSAKAKMNKKIEELNAKMEKGNFSMETGEFSIGNANFGAIEPVAMARGGKLNGPSDINGPGMPIQGSNIVVGGGEYVVNAKATAENEPLLNRINSGEKISMADGGIIPKIKNIVPDIMKSPLAPLKIAAKPIHETFKMAMGIDKMEVAPIKLDVSGTIKLDAGGQQVDLNAIVNNPAFLTQITQMIERRLADNINGGNFKELKKNKQHTF